MQLWGVCEKIWKVYILPSCWSGWRDHGHQMYHGPILTIFSSWSNLLVFVNWSELDKLSYKVPRSLDCELQVPAKIIRRRQEYIDCCLEVAISRKLFSNCWTLVKGSVWSMCCSLNVVICLMEAIVPVPVSKAIKDSCFYTTSFSASLNASTWRSGSFIPKL